MKVIRPEQVASPAAVERFRREVRAAAKLIHPNIVIAYDAGEAKGVHYLVMEYVEGQDLGSVVRERGPLSVQGAVECILQAARGLEYAHQRGVIHRDIKPANLILSKEGVVKILDLGLARLKPLAVEDSRQGDRLTGTGMVMGTVDYIAPEQIRQSHEVDGRADIYSLGCTLYRLLTGRAVYEADSAVQVLVAHLEAPIPSVAAARAEVPMALDLIFQKMVAKRPEDRYQSMGEVIRALEGLLREMGVALGRGRGGVGQRPGAAGFFGAISAWFAGPAGDGGLGGQHTAGGDPAGGTSPQPDSAGRHSAVGNPSAEHPPALCSVELGGGRCGCGPAGGRGSAGGPSSLGEWTSGWEGSCLWWEPFGERAGSFRGEGRICGGFIAAASPAGDPLAGGSAAGGGTGGGRSAGEAARGGRSAAGGSAAAGADAGAASVVAGAAGISAGGAAGGAGRGPGAGHPAGVDSSAGGGTPAAGFRGHPASRDNGGPGCRRARQVRAAV